MHIYICTTTHIKYIANLKVTSPVKKIESSSKEKLRTCAFNFIYFEFFTSIYSSIQFSSVAQSCPTLCDPMHHSMPGLLSGFPQTHVHWVGDAIQPSHPVVPFSSHPQSFPASGSFQMSQLFASGGQIIGVSASASAFPMNIQDWFPLGWTHGSPCSPRDSQESSPTPEFKSINSSVLSFLSVQLSHPYMTTGKTIPYTRRTFVGKVMSLLFNMLSRLVITFQGVSVF